MPAAQPKQPLVRHPRRRALIYSSIPSVLPWLSNRNVCPPAAGDLAGRPVSLSRPLIWAVDVIAQLCDKGSCVNVSLGRRVCSGPRLIARHETMGEVDQKDKRLVAGFTRIEEMGVFYGSKCLCCGALLMASSVEALYETEREHCKTCKLPSYRKAS